jgi:mono/diheme cytochrome c family protein
MFMKMILAALSIAAVSAGVALAADAKAGAAVYDKSCKSCHGADGTPNPAIAKMMKVEMKDLKSADVQGMSEADIKKVVAEGKGKMKPVASVTGAAADNVAAYVHSLKK